SASPLTAATVSAPNSSTRCTTLRPRAKKSLATRGASLSMAGTSTPREKTLPSERTRSSFTFRARSMVASGLSSLSSSAGEKAFGLPSSRNTRSDRPSATVSEIDSSPRATLESGERKEREPAAGGNGKGDIARFFLEEIGDLDPGRLDQRQIIGAQ